MQDLTVSIISHEHRDYIPRCLESLFEHTSEIDFEVHLVLNMSEDGFANQVSRSFPQVKVLKNPSPVGFSENNNRIYSATRSRYFLLLNPDTVLLNNALDRLVAFLDAHSDAAVCGPRLLYPDGRLQLNCRYFPSLGSVVLRRTPLRALFPYSRIARDYTLAEWDHRSVREVDWIFGAFLMVRRSAVDAVGPLDEGYFMFCEDIDWCYRLKRAGWKIYYVPDAVAQHDLNDDSYNRFLGTHRMIHYRSMYRYWRKNMLFRKGT
ncbi:glycosyltransferase family 2 protein [Thermodesulfobacteriota bacterium]